MIPLPPEPLIGHLEGYYGRLLAPGERETLLDALARNAMNAWWHAPKEDPTHRLRWRESPSEEEATAFARFCRRARGLGVHVIAGLAPGIDFAWRHVDGGPDLERLAARTAALLDAGAGVAALLLDDLDDDFAARAPSGASEGAVHARLANALGETLGRALVVVPRIYADELHATAPDYLPDFSAALDERHGIALCGSDVVARTVSLADCRRRLVHDRHRIVAWDNLYANDYCPRRLFLGPWTGRADLVDVLVNPTGLPATDALLLDVVGDERAHPGRTDAERAAGLARIRARHGVPEAFETIARHFVHPATNPVPGDGSANAATGPEARDAARRAVGASGFAVKAATGAGAGTGEGANGANGVAPDGVPSAASLAASLAALDTLQWRWKTPLAREWYPFLAGLRHDLSIAAGTLAPLRVAKTQPGALALALLRPPARG